MTAPWAEAVLLDVLSEFRGGDASSLPPTQRQLLHSVAGLSDAQCRRALEHAVILATGSAGALDAGQVVRGALGAAWTA